MKKDRKRILVTAGSTIEPIDPVRYISNFSTGLAGYEIAAACAERGHKVCLISGPSSIVPPMKVKVVHVSTAREMMKAIEGLSGKIDCIVMAAAVCDFRPVKEAKRKIKTKRGFSLNLVRNPDIIAGIKPEKEQIRIGFALETGKIENCRKKALRKIRKKGLDLIVLNTKTPSLDPFGAGRKDFALLWKDGREKRLKGITKKAMARILVEEAERMMR